MDNRPPDFAIGRAEKDWESICTSLECTRDLLRKIDSILQSGRPDAIAEARKLVIRALQIVP